MSLKHRQPAKPMGQLTCRSDIKLHPTIVDGIEVTKSPGKQVLYITL
jgi:hypothetical protein